MLVLSQKRVSSRRPRSENRPQSKNPSNYSQNNRNWECKSDVRNKSNQNAILRQNYSFDNGNNSDMVCENHFQDKCVNKSKTCH